MVMKFHANVRGEVRVSFLALSASKPHIFMCSALKLSGSVRASVRLNIAISMLVWYLIQSFPCSVLRIVIGVVSAVPFGPSKKKVICKTQGTQQRS